MEERELTGYPSIDKPWLKYYDQEVIEAELPECTIYEAIYNSNADNLDSIALNYYGCRITYCELFRRIDETATALSALGVKPGEVVSVCMINSPETIYLLYGLNKIGAVANMISGLSEAEEVIKYINDVHSSKLFILDIFQDKILKVIEFTSLQKVVVTNLTDSMGFTTRMGAIWLKGMKPRTLPKDVRFQTWNQFISHSCKIGNVIMRPVDAAVITYTGGTTGGSKGVELSNKSIISVAQQYIWCRTALQEGQTWLQVIPLYVAFGVCASLQLPLMAGQTIILRIPLSETLAEMCEKHKPNHIVFGPVQWEQLANENRNIDLSFLIEPTSGGDKLPLPVEEKINAYLTSHNSDYSLMNGYGMSEVGAGVSVNFKHAHCPGSVGIPFCKNIISAFNIESGKECQYGQEGEICICTPSMMTQYINNPEETANVIREHSDGQKWVHSGDLGYITEDGFVFISGRLKRFFIYIDNGEQKKIFSLDIEKVLLTHPSVENCAVVPISDQEHSQVAKAYIQLKTSYRIETEIEATLRAYCLERLDERACPRVYEFVNDFPRTSLGKIDFRKLEQYALEMPPQNSK